MMRTIFANLVRCLGVLLLAPVAPAALAETYGSGWYRELQLAVGHEDNVSRSFQSADLTDDTIASATFGLGYSDKIRDNIQYVLSGYISYTHHDRFHELSNVATSLNARMVYQPSASYHSIWYDTSLDLTRIDYDDSEERNGYLASVSMSINKRLGMRTNGRIGYRYHDLMFLEKNGAEKTHDAAFDVARHELFTGFDYEIGDDVVLVMEYGFQHGGFTTTSSSTPPPSAEYEAQTPDHVFETCTALGCIPWYAFRTISDVHGADVGIAFSFAGVDYDVTARYIDARAKGDLKYVDWMLQLGLIWNF
jgi:opacity protein-like surface antigen